MIRQQYVNLNTHVVNVKRGGEIVVYPRFKNKPTIKYKKITDNTSIDKASALITVGIDDLPLPIPGILYIVNRDIIRAQKILEKNILEKYPDIKESADPNLKKKMKRFVDRVDLRAPGKQVRDKKTKKVLFCTELINRFE